MGVVSHYYRLRGLLWKAALDFTSLLPLDVTDQRMLGIRALDCFACSDTSPPTAILKPARRDDGSSSLLNAPLVTCPGVREETYD